MIIFIIHALPLVTRDNGTISEILVMIGLKSMLSCLVGAHLILIEHMICGNRSAQIDNFAYFLISSTLFDAYSIMMMCNPKSSRIYSYKDMIGTANYNERRNNLFKQCIVNCFCHFL